ncbi:MAG: YgfZ/GcvT domain-containing protein [Ignavibacteriales bacterium]
MFAPLPSRALIAVTGEDWRAFLQGQLTQDVSSLGLDEARFAALLTPQGRLLFDMFIIGREGGCWLDVEASQRDALIQRLTLYRLRAKVEFAPDPSSISALFTAHPDASRDPSGASGWAPASAGVSGLWVADPRAPELGWRGYGVEKPEAELTNEMVYDRHRLTLGAPGPADWGSDRTYPIEANFDLLNGIDFRKGCFVGQETTSRMKRRGAIKNRMLPVTFEGPPPPFGTEVLKGELRAGEILSGQDGIAMALLRLDRLDGDLTADGRKIRVARPTYALS